MDCKKKRNPELTMGVQAGESLTIEKSRAGRRGADVPALGVPLAPLAEALPSWLIRQQAPALPELSELDVVRHFTRLSKLNMSVDENMYPLGSCTMKYNPRVNEHVVRLPGFARLHPWTLEEGCQGALELIYRIERALTAVTGLSAVTVQPAAGAHGELTGVMMIMAAIKDRGEKRDTMLVPDSAHGTNPATCALAGLKVKEVPTGADGVIDPAVVASLLDSSVAGIMITNPNTVGLFERNISEIARLVHAAGGFVYMDGANFNAILGQALPGDFGIDAMHINLHKTFSQPHGGGGPGAGPVAVSEALRPYLPYPRVEREMRSGLSYYTLSYEGAEKSIGCIREFVGSFGVLVRAFAYMLRLGDEGLRKVSQGAVLNARYLRALLEDDYELAYQGDNLHEVVFTDAKQKQNGISTLDIAKRLLDYGAHPPTIYFPLTVKGSLMIEPTETESKETIDAFAAAMSAIAKEAKESPEIFANAPYSTPCARLDETAAARNPILNWQQIEPRLSSCSI